MIVIANLVKYLLASLNKYRINVLLVGEDKLVEKVKESIVKSDNYVYIGRCRNEKINELDKKVVEKK